jgi:hypothetical protein
MKFSIALVPLVLVLTGTSALAQWQWLDKDGRKVFSDRAPPPEVTDKNIVKRPGNNAKAPAPADAAETTAGAESGAEPATSVSGASKTSGLDKDIEAKKKQLADADAAKLKAEQDKVVKAKIENCARAKQAKTTFDAGVRLSKTNAAGEREILDDAGRASEAKRIQSVIDSDCK